MVTKETRGEEVSAPFVAASSPSLYGDPLRYDLLAQMTAPADLPFYLERAGRREGAILEIGCGTGRITLPLAEVGHRVTGVDLSPALLEHGRLKAKRGHLRVELLEMDARDLALKKRFGLILIPYNAFNHMLEVEDAVRCLRAAAAHLAPGGRLILDTFQPDPAALVGPFSERTPVITYRDPYTKEHVVLEEQSRYDPATQINHIRWSDTVDGRVDARVDSMQMRIFFPKELEALIRLGGLRIEERLGDYDGRPFGPRTPKQMVIASVANDAGTAPRP